MTAIELLPARTEKKEDVVVDIKEEDSTLKKKEKKEKKKKKKKRKHDAAAAAADVSSANDDDIAGVQMEKEDDPEKEDEKSDSKKKSRRQEKEALMEQVPEKDEDGIVYTKLQRRRMMKRVKRGLPPVPTPKEEDERIKNDAALKREEEAELAGKAYNQNEKEENSEEEEESEAEEQEEIPTKVNDDDNNNQGDGDDTPSKKAKRPKLVPSDYVCQACKNKNQPAHWIYDCPAKVTMRGVNQKSKRTRGLHDPDEKKIFVSGLPFEAKRKDVELLFNKDNNNTLVQCKLLTFPDTGRCKGQAYLTFDSVESAKEALKLNGTIIPPATIDNDNNDKRKKSKESSSTRKELRLIVSKMLNRNTTKRGNRS